MGLVLPNELLAEIFRAGCKPAVDAPFQVLVSHVCQRWREVAVSTPSLWALIDVSGHPFSYLEACIERSKHCLLDIYIRLDDFDKPCRYALKESLDLIIPEIDRWHRLVVDARFFSSVLHIYMALRHRLAPQLKHIEMCLNDSFGLEGLWREPETSFLGILNGGAPRLSSFSLWGISLHYCHPPLDSLTTLSLTTPFDSEASMPLSFDKFCQVLSVTTKLTELSLHGRVLFHDGQTYSPVEVPSLLKLNISSPADNSSAQCEYILRICAVIYAPSLAYLTVNFLGRVHPPPSLKYLRIRSNSHPFPILSHRMVASGNRRKADISLTLSLPPVPKHPCLPGLDPTQLADILVARVMSALHPSWISLHTILASEIDEYRLFCILSSSLASARCIQELYVFNSQAPVSKHE